MGRWEVTAEGRREEDGDRAEDDSGECGDEEDMVWKEEQDGRLAGGRKTTASGY